MSIAPPALGRSYVQKDGLFSSGSTWRAPVGAAPALQHARVNQVAPERRVVNFMVTQHIIDFCFGVPPFERELGREPTQHDASRISAGRILAQASAAHILGEHFAIGRL